MQFERRTEASAQVRLLRPDRNGQGAEPQKADPKARTVPREGIEREEKLLAKEDHHCIRRVPRA